MNDVSAATVGKHLRGQIRNAASKSNEKSKVKKKVTWSGVVSPTVDNKVTMSGCGWQMGEGGQQLANNMSTANPNRLSTSLRSCHSFQMKQKGANRGTVTDVSLWRIVTTRGGGNEWQVMGRHFLFIFGNWKPVRVCTTHSPKKKTTLVVQSNANIFFIQFDETLQHT